MSTRAWVSSAVPVALLLVAGCPVVTPQQTTEELNMQVVRDSYEKLWNQDDETQFDDIVQIPGYVHHETDRPDVVFASYAELDAGFDAAQHTMPDLHYTINRMFASGDEVVVQWTALGTFTNDYGPIPATGEQVSYTGFTVYRLANGKIVESYTEDDDQDILEALTNTDLDSSGIIAGDVP
jgi:predicted ester cyclase